MQVYAARTVGWRGVLAVHTWIAVKQSGAPSYTRYEVMGWGVSRGAPALRVNRTGPVKGCPRKGPRLSTSAWVDARE